MLAYNGIDTDNLTYHDERFEEVLPSAFVRKRDEGIDHGEKNLPEHFCLFFKPEEAHKLTGQKIVSHSVLEVLKRNQ